MTAKRANRHISTCLKSGIMESGAAMVELAISFFVALTIVLGTVHIGSVLREANTIVEASRHGARTAGALSGIAVGVPLAVAPWVTTPGTDTVADCGVAPGGNPGNVAAITAACRYITESGLVATEWMVSSTIWDPTLLAEGGLSRVYSISVTVSPKTGTARGPVTAPWAPLNFKVLLNLQPQGTSIFPLEVL